MLKGLRVLMVTVATLSMLLLAGPAGAGMVETPQSPSADQVRAQAIDSVKAHVVGAGLDGERAATALQSLDTAQLLALQSQVEASRAGSTGFAIGIGVAVVAAVVFVIFETFYPY
ncbi:MAG: hypothetical protein HUU15_14290 [Candidatus Brocadiae bacterium]|nr:hypothetical protein [Candidatus Brocadiia bacterium]